jgi:hypothetical protein
MEDLVIYTTTQTHSIGVKAGLVLGLSVRALDVTSTLQAALKEDEKNGRKPFILSKSKFPHHIIDIFGALPSRHGWNNKFWGSRQSEGDSRSW